MLHTDNQDRTADEVIKSCLNVFDKTGTGSKEEFEEELRFCKKMLKAIIAPFWEEPQEIVTVESPYDIAAWGKNDYRGTLGEYRLPQSAEFQFKIMT